MTRVQFSIGQGFDANGSKLLGLRDRKRTAYQFIARTFGGFSASKNDGGWLNPDGGLVLENDLTIITVVDDDKLPLVDGAANVLADVFNQASVLITTDNVTARFTSRGGN